LALIDGSGLGLGLGFEGPGLGLGLDLRDWFYHGQVNIIRVL